MEAQPCKSAGMKSNNQHLKRLLFILLGGGGLFSVYFFQDYLDFYSLLQGEPLQRSEIRSEYQNLNPLAFVVNKVIRYLLNDLFAMAIIYGLFFEIKYLRFAFWVLLFGLLFLLPSYLFLYLSQPAGFSSMIAHLHRLVLNPVLMMLLIPAFYYQRKLARA